MRRLKKKLKNQDGASLILALLVFLLCVMVASSVLAAAASNAGKAKSSQVEQQKYLTLSSALQLICGELEKVEYIGKYKVYTWDDDSGTDYFYCEQKPGEFKVQSSDPSALSDPSSDPAEKFRLIDIGSMKDDLQKEMDEVFSKQFQNAGGSGAGYEPMYAASEQNADPIYLTVTLPDGLVGYPYKTGSTPKKKYEISKEVTVKIELNHDTRVMTLTAWLVDNSAEPTVQPNDGSGIMVAELRTADSFSALDVSPGNTGAADLPAPGLLNEAEKPTASMKWKLDRMVMTTSSSL